MNKWRGLEGVEMIWHGSQSDPELKYDGVVANYWTVEDWLYDMFREENLYEDDIMFNKWLKDNFHLVQDIFQQIKEYNIL